ncbi:hypothetical protein ANANG_G00168420 [Anguilla anguilla]|uniref:HMG box domain-containing protein n=1 Tax=Anguilla anguilla TaxID=7936 RepID=A0A9D3M2Z6_ANGAN|nr:hypothetical protein ANANG_G00168420 [Anguilla anguilla]
MDVRFYPPPVPQNSLIPPPSATDPSCPEPSLRFDPLYCNQFDRENMYMSMSEPIQDFSPVCQAYPVSSLGDDDFNIPPITPPALPELTLPPRPESEPGTYHSLRTPVTQSGLHPFHPYRMDSPEVTISNTLSQDGGPAPSFLSAMLRKTSSSQCGAYPQVDDFRPCIQSVMVQHGQLTTINQSELSAHLGLSGNDVVHGSPSPPGSKRRSPSPSSSTQEDEADGVLKGVVSQGGGAEKRQAADLGKPPKVQKKKKKKDPNEPQKPVSAYALFFRDTQAAIKGQNPSATFGEVSKIVASTWDGLEDEQKQLYKRKTEVAKTEYLKQLAAYRANLVSQSYYESGEVTAPQGSQSPAFPRSGQANSGVYPERSHPQHLRPTAPMPTPLPGANMASPMSLPGANMASPMSLPGANMASLMSLTGANMASQMSLPGANMASSMSLPRANMAASSPPPHPTMQRGVSLQHQQQFVPMQKPLGNHQPFGNHHHQLPLHPQTTAQGFLPQAEFLGMLSRTSTVGLALTPPTDYSQSGCRDSSSQGLDWSVDYYSNGTLQR